MPVLPLLTLAFYFSGSCLVRSFLNLYSFVKSYLLALIFFVSYCIFASYFMNFYFLLSFYCLSSLHFSNLLSCFLTMGFQHLWFLLSSLGTYFLFTVDDFLCTFTRWGLPWWGCLASLVCSFAEKPCDSLWFGPAWVWVEKCHFYGDSKPYW